MLNYLLSRVVHHTLCNPCIRKTLRHNCRRPGHQFYYPEGLANFQLYRSLVRSQYLEDVLLSVEKERRKRRGPLTRRFIVTEGIFEKDGAMVDLPKLVSYDYPRQDGYVLTYYFLK